ncbi:hypothetical protein [Oceanobacillus halophilus]|uniref:Uncharacterized protein n=1 Tax=Oceanobacillus halophilus TaxID=930130 RepID=A0A495A388_9BACI|nr:hypothetical protein [Oceanobacillus halophilus]RKQ33964.1 hypothetical protein D8M06_09080 [Oceanobacillus halophilus]
MKNKKLYIIITLVAFVIAGIGFFAFNFISDRMEEQKAIEAEKASIVEDLKSENPDLSDTVQVSEDTEVENTEDVMKATKENTVIANIHEDFNDMTGWGRYHNFDFNNSKVLNRLQRIQEQIEAVIQESSDEALIGDFTNALLVLEKAIETEDVQGILYAHRIFHDLDIHINNYDSKEIFGITEWKNGRQPRSINSYLGS